MRSSRLITIPEVLIFVGIIAVLYATVHLWHAPSAPSTTPPVSPPVATSGNKIVLVSPEHLPENFPSDIPFIGQSSSSVIENYNYGPLGHSVQATHTFESSQLVAESYNAYKNFFEDTKNGWILLEASTDPADPNIRFLAARNVNGVATVNITRNIGSGATLVEISFVPKK